MILAAAALGKDTFQAFGSALMTLIGQADRLSEVFVTDGGAPIFGGLLVRVAVVVSPIFVVPAVMAILAIIAQQSFTVAPDKLRPKLSRISIMSNAKNKFGRAGLFEFFKSFVKLVIYSVALGVFLIRHLPAMAATIWTDPAIAAAAMFEMCMDFLVVVLIVAGAMGAVDYMWQRAEHLRKNRMSDKELRDEHKESEGDPHMKSERRARGQQIAMSQMMTDVPQADVIITNPTHYAVALQWSREPGAAPVCVAKGVDHVAAQIRKIAQENGVPIHRDPPTARAIHASTDIGQEIVAEHYHAVAAAIRFADQMRNKARSSWR